MFAGGGNTTNQSTPLRHEKEKCHLLNETTTTTTTAEYHQEQLTLGPMKLNRVQIKVLIVFPKEDALKQAWTTVLTSRGHEIVLATHLESVSKTLAEQSFDIVIVDARTPKNLRPECVAEAVLNSEGHNANAIVIGIVRRK